MPKPLLPSLTTLAALCLVLLPLTAACVPERPGGEGEDPAAAGDAGPATPQPPPAGAGAAGQDAPPPESEMAGSGGRGEASVAPSAAAPESTSSGLDLRSHAWDCDNGMYVVTEQRVDEEGLILYLPRGPIPLEPREAASGARWSDGTTVFWNQGNEARLELGDREATTCRENRRRSVIEAAKLSGAEVWATGNEPGWTLRIFPDRLVLVTDYGQRAVQTPRPDPVTSADGGAITYRAETGDHRLAVTLREKTCRDSLSGEDLDTTVEVTLDGKTYQGCGLVLRD